MLTSSKTFVAFLGLELSRENRRILETALLEYFGAKQFQNVFALLDLILDQNVAAAAKVDAQGVDSLYLAALIELVKTCPLNDGEAIIHTRRRLHSIGADYEFFHAIRDDPDWSLPRCLNFLYRAKLRPSKKIAIVTSIRNEGINIIEWIAHHRMLGVDDFIIYANDNDDGSTALLNALAAHGVIHLVWNETGLAKDGTTDMFPIQAKAFGHACEFLVETRQFEWLLFADMDEFFITQAMRKMPDAARPLDDLFNRLAAMAAAPSAVAFHWKWFTSDCQFRRESGLNFQRFRNFVHSDYVKTMARSDRCLSFSTSHMPRLPHGDIILDSALQPITNPAFQMPTVYAYGQINHYWNKSFEEFISRHLRVRGDRAFSNFFDYGNNRAQGAFETVPAAWIARVAQEVENLNALPGIPDALSGIEIAFAAQIEAFDRKHDCEALFYRHFVREV